MSTKIKGIDVSRWQGDIDWAKVAADGVKFAMVRLGYGDNDGTGCGVDMCFHKNVEGALANGIAVGCYFYSYGTTVKKVEEEAAFVLKTLDPYKGRILYPIAYDLEDKTQAGLGGDTLTKMVIAFCSAIEKGGYYACLYSNPDWLTHRLNVEALARFDLWLALWAEAPNYKKRSFGMWQSGIGQVKGISGGVDMDTSFVDYEALIKERKLNGYTGEKPAPTPAKPTTTEKVYIVKSGDTLSGIAEKYGTTYQALAEYNNIPNPNIITTGQKIKIPGTAPKAPAIKVGDVVRLRLGAKTYTGGGIALFVYRRDHRVSELRGDRAVITYGGTVVAAVNVADLIKV